MCSLSCITEHKVEIIYNFENKGWFYKTVYATIKCIICMDEINVKKNVGLVNSPWEIVNKNTCDHKHFEVINEEKHTRKDWDPDNSSLTFISIIFNVIFTYLVHHHLHPHYDHLHHHVFPSQSSFPATRVD